MKERDKITPDSKEILDLPNYGGVYGRFLISVVKPHISEDFINPSQKINVDLTDVNISLSRDYDSITQKLSTEERLEAWKEMEFIKAYDQWKKNFTKSIKTATDEKRIETIKLISGKLASEFNEEDTEKLYQTFCKGKSNTTSFAKSIISKIQKDGIIETAKIKTLSSDIEWFAGRLFGKQTAEAVTKIIELEAEITNNPTTIVNKLFLDKKRINNLTESETTMLTRLYGGLNATRIETEPTTQSAVNPQQDAEPRTRDETPAGPDTPKVPFNQENKPLSKPSRFEEVTKENWEKYKDKDYFIEANGMQWKIVEIVKIDEIDNAILERKKTIRELNKILEKTFIENEEIKEEEDKKRINIAVFIKRSRTPIASLIGNANWVLEPGIRIPNDPKRLQEIADLDSFRAKINAEDITIKDVLKEAQEIAEQEKQRLNREKEQFDKLNSITKSQPTPTEDHEDLSTDQAILQFMQVDDLTHKPGPESIVDRLSKGQTIQYQGKPYTISDIEGDEIYLLGPNGHLKKVDLKYLDGLLADPYSPWKLLDETGNLLSLSLNESESEDNVIIPPPINDQA